MNKIVLLGRMVRDPEIRYTQSGKVVASFTLAVNRPFQKDGVQEADFINCVLWGKQAETVGNNVTKGQRLLVSGRLQIRSYDAKDGSKRYVTEVMCEDFEFIERKGDNVSHNTDAPAPANSGQKSCMDSFGQAAPSDDDFSDIPF